jgi:hypothetical protein
VIGLIRSWWLGAWVPWLLGSPVVGPAPRAQESLPAFSCATFPLETSHAGLAARFGADNVTTSPVYGFDDGPTDGTVLFPDDSTARVEIIWRDPESKSRARWIMVRGEHSRWRAPNGITLGTGLRTLERMNGRPFRLAGFRNEISGRVRSWGGGRLEPEDREACTLTVSLYLRPGDDKPGDPLKQVAQGTNYSSGHPAMQALNPRVVALVLEYPRP